MIFDQTQQKPVDICVSNSKYLYICMTTASSLLEVLDQTSFVRYQPDVDSDGLSMFVSIFSCILVLSLSADVFL